MKDASLCCFEGLMDRFIPVTESMCPPEDSRSSLISPIHASASGAVLGADQIGGSFVQMICPTDRQSPVPRLAPFWGQRRHRKRLETRKMAIF